MPAYTSSRTCSRPSDIIYYRTPHDMPVYNYSIYVTKTITVVRIIIKRNDQILLRRRAAMPSKFVNFIFSFPILQFMMIYNMRSRYTRALLFRVLTIRHINQNVTSCKSLRWYTPNPPKIKINCFSAEFAKVFSLSPLPPPSLSLCFSNRVAAASPSKLLQRTYIPYVYTAIIFTTHAIHKQ